MTTSERRIGLDRRHRPTPLWNRYLIKGRRHAVRRDDDPQAVYVDRVGVGYGTLILLVFSFHVLDALFTLRHLQRGGTELNPLMAYCLEHGPWTFLWIKLGMAGVGLIFLALHKNFPFVRAGVVVLFLIFAILVGYHGYLFAVS